MAATIAAGIVRELARDIDALNQRIADLDAQIAALLEEHGNPVADLLGAGNQTAAALIAHAGDVRRFRDAAAFARFCGAAPIPGGSRQTSGRHRLHRGATASSTPPSTACVDGRRRREQLLIGLLSWGGYIGRVHAVRR